MNASQMSTPSILAAIDTLQGVQKSCAPTTANWREASAQLKPLFAEMAKREPSEHPIHGPIELFGYRFEEYGTGGNCLALRAEMEDGTEILITAREDAYLPTPKDWSIGFYNRDGDVMATATSAGDYECDEELLEANDARCDDCERSYGPGARCTCGDDR